MTIAYAYEVELQLTNINTKAVTTVTRTEHAYSVQDAIYQALFNQAGELETGSAEIRVLHVGPTADAIAAATTELARRIQERIRHAFDSSGITVPKARL